MRLDDYKKEFYEFSAKASDTSRAAAFGGIAIIWVFRITTATVPQLPKELLIPLSLFTAALGFDLLHYTIATIIWGFFHRINEMRLRNPTNNPNLAHPSYLSLPIWTLFFLKIASVLVGYVTLLNFIWRLWFK